MEPQFIYRAGEVDAGWDEYSDFVVIARSESEARDYVRAAVEMTHQQAAFDAAPITKIGVVTSDVVIANGIVVSSFHAG